MWTDEIDYLMGAFETWAAKERLLNSMDVTESPLQYTNPVTRMYFKAFCAGIEAQKNKDSHNQLQISN